MQANPSNAGQSERLLRLPEVMARVVLSRSAIYEAIASGKFPHGLKLSRRAVAWSSKAIDEWIAGRIQAGGK
jgi:prophage regulatory protein